MKKLIMGLIICGLLGITLMLTAMTSGSSNSALDMTRTAIAQANTTNGALIQATQMAHNNYDMGTPSPYPQALPIATMTVASEIIDQREKNRGSSSPPVDNSIQQRRIVIYTANLRIIADQPDRVIEEIGVLAEDIGGWVVNSNASVRNGSQSYGTIDMRVPADQLDYTVEAIKGYAVTVTSEVISGDDVTNQYVDIASRLKNLQASETQLQDIMLTTDDVDGVLAVFRELTRIRGDIESIQGQLSYYDESSMFSSVTVNVDPVAPEPTLYVAPEWSPSHAVDNALVELEQSIQKLVDGLIWLVIVGSPFALILLILGYMMFHIGRVVWGKTQ